MISRDEILKGRDKQYPLDSELENNLNLLLIALNKFRTIYNQPMYVSSGYRPGVFNAAAGGAKKSAHMSCQAADFKDEDRKLRDWCLNNLQILEDCGLYMEDPAYTPTWVHLQIRPTKNRVFKPY